MLKILKGKRNVRLRGPTRNGPHQDKISLTFGWLVKSYWRSEQMSHKKKRRRRGFPLHVIFERCHHSDRRNAEESNCPRW